ncbi:hypothetical protein JZ751_006952 [Albula glossodonta]|uniref:Ig-like domain-containing protein n=1 Tax=Albula glossodonta TaxID=121402 RepID=A0A8T2P5U3_9TELE|nr:hypothetical protein JZ751_006952 [Albula glossodonta]
MFSLLLALVILERSCVTPENAIFQPQRTVSAQVGDSVTLECCTHTDKAKRWLWLKHSPGQAAERIMSTYYGNSQLHGDLRDSGRATVKMNGKSINMTLSALRFSDAAMYYCVLADYDDFLFGGGTFLTITGSECSNGTVIQQPVSEPLQPGDSVTLQCSIHTETCAGEHSVYWFRQASGESLPGIIYTHGNRSDQCERSSGAGSPTQSCVYKLPKRNLGRSDAGTYYCAVATCGEILFGNGTKLDITGSLGQDAVVFGLVAVCMLFTKAQALRQHICKQPEHGHRRTKLCRIES